MVIIRDYGPEEFLKRLADPVWFQGLGCVLGFDWHSSGLTTVTLGALKEGLKHDEKNLGVFICGGKGKTSLRTPTEIKHWSFNLGLNKEQEECLVTATRLSAKVDSVCLQDGYNLYHHNFIFTKQGSWAVVQQGMNEAKKMARRYHWFCDHGEGFDFIKNPHVGIAAWKKENPLDLTAEDSEKTRDIDLNLVGGSYKCLEKDLNSISRAQERKSTSILNLPRHHPVFDTDVQSTYIKKTLHEVCDREPDDFCELISLKGVGQKTIRALSLVSELIYGAKPSYKDPARYSFAHGGKDGYPRPLDKETYDNTISVFEKGIKKSKLGVSKKNEALNRLGKLF